MEHKKDIGKAIRERLDALDKAPGDHLWAAIEADLPKKKKRRLLPFWIGFVSVTVIGLLLWSLLNPENNGPTRGESVGSENIPTQSEGTNRGEENGAGNSGATNEHAIGTATNQPQQGSESHDSGVLNAPTADGQSNNEVSAAGNAPGPGNITNPAKRAGATQKQGTTTRNGRKKAHNGKFSANTSTKSSSRKQVKTAANIADDHQPAGFNGANPALTDGKSANGIGANQNAANGASKSGATDSDTPTATQQTTTANDSIAKALAEEKKKKTEKPQDSLPTQELEQEAFKTFRIFLYAAPTYYNTFSKISSIDKDLDSLPRKAEITYNYGGYLCFDYDDKWAFRFGVAKTSLRYRTQGIPVSSLDQQNYYNVDYGSVSNLELQTRFADSERFDLIQDISYLEFPVEIKYKLAGGNFGIEGIGGVSTSLLKGNSVTAESDHNGSVVIGSTKDQYKAYFSVNVGAGFYWRFADNFRLNVEPIFKYHFRTASTALQPYSVVVLGGLEYTFNWRNKKKAEKK